MRFEVQMSISWKEDTSLHRIADVFNSTGENGESLQGVIRSCVSEFKSKNPQAKNVRIDHVDLGPVEVDAILAANSILPLEAKEKA